MGWLYGNGHVMDETVLKLPLRLLGLEEKHTPFQGTMILTNYTTPDMLLLYREVNINKTCRKPRTEHRIKSEHARRGRNEQHT